MKREVEVKVKLHNRFDVFVKNINTGKETQVAYAENIVLNNYWNRLISSTGWDGVTAWWSWLHLGTGTGVLDPTRTALFNRISSKRNMGGVYAMNYDEGYFSRRINVTYSETELVGQTLTEVGVATDETSGLLTHALLMDMNGNPVSIVKTNTDIITIYATVYLVFPVGGILAGGKARFTSLGNNLTADALHKTFLGVRPAGPASIRIGFSNRRVPSAYNLSMSGNDFTGTIQTPSNSYDVANKKVTFSGRIAVGSGNFTYGILGISIGFGTNASAVYDTFFQFDVLDMDGVPDSEIVGEQIGVGDGNTTNFKTTYGLVKAGNVVKVDGVAVVSGVTVDENQPADTNITPYMKLVDVLNTTYGMDHTYGIFPGSNVSTNRSGLNGVEYIYENPFYNVLGITSLSIGKGLRLQVSNDLSSWTTIQESAGATTTVNVATEYQGYRYWKLVTITTYNAIFRNIINSAHTHNVHFDTAPVEGKVVTIDYDTPVIAKDVNHVLDYSLSVYFTDYVEE